MRLLLLGAGASKSYGNSPTGMRMPIARDFFPTFYSLAAAANPWVLRDGLMFYLAHECGISDPDAYLTSGVDIEEIHSEIALKLASAARKPHPFERIIYAKPYVQLMFLFAATLNEIANGPVSRSHLELAHFLDPADVIVTFNWDTLMERALMETGLWHVDHGYGIKPYRVFRDGWEEPAPPKPTSSPKIIKLHGSVNWLTAYPTFEAEEFVLTHALPAESLFVYDHATRPYATYAGRYMGGYAPMTYGYYPPNLSNVPGRAAPEGQVILQIRPRFPWMPEGGADNAGLVSMPLIIPPVREKSYKLFGSLFENLWLEAERALQTCDEIIVVGYSFPRTDLRTHTLFTQAFMNRDSIPHVTIIDPSPDRPAEKFRRHLGVPDTHLRIIPAPFEGAATLRMLAS